MTDTTIQVADVAIGGLTKAADDPNWLRVRRNFITSMQDKYRRRMDELTAIKRDCEIDITACRNFIAELDRVLTPDNRR